MISKIADGLDTQRGAVFGFGAHKDDDTGSLVKVSNTTEKEMTELNKAPVHNLAEERSVGSINNELKVRGKRNLETVSRKLILNKLINQMIYLKRSLQITTINSVTKFPKI